MSLTSCLKKAGSALRPADKAAILALSRTYRADGMTPDDAAKKAIAEQIAAVQKLIAKEEAKSARGKTEAVTNPQDVVGNQGGRSADDNSPGTDESTGLPLNADGTVTVYHHTSKTAADSIRRTGTLKAQAEPDVYVTTRRETDTGYGDTAVAINVNPDQLAIDDEFPDGRKDFRLTVGRPGGSIKVAVANESTAPTSGGALTSPTKADILTQQQRQADGDKAAAQADRAGAQKAKADSEVNEFTLTGSDRSADVGAAGGQDAMFNRPDGGYNVANGNYPESSTAATEADIELLTRAVPPGKRFGNVSPFVSRPINTFLLDGSVLGELAGALGSRIAGFATNPVLSPEQRAQVAKFNGVYLNQTIFIREGTDRPNLAVLGHEFGHVLRESSPALYAKLIQSIRPYVKGEAYAAFKDKPVAKGLTDAAAIREEFIGEVFSDGFMDKGFWRAVGDSSPDTLAKLVQSLGKLIDKIKSKVGYTKRTEAYLSDYKAVMRIAGEVMAEYAGGQDAMFSIADQQAKAYTPPDGLQAAPARQQQLADQLAARLNGNLNAGRVSTVLHAVAPRAGDTSDRARSLAAAALTAKRLFGHEVVFVDFGGKPLFNGAMSRAIPGVVFIRVDSPKPHMAILGHELLHQLRASNPGLYNELDAKLTALLSEKGATDFLTKLEAQYRAHGLAVPNNWDEELWADVAGDNFIDPEFLQALGAEQPALFKRVVDAITKFLNTVIAKLAVSDLQPFGTRQYLTDAKAAREAVAKAFREFSGTQVGAMTDQRETVSMSIADKPLQKETAAFKKWFGDSKVVDDDGKPRVMYHGTTVDFTAFDPTFMYSGEGASQTGSGFYFTSDPESASAYAGIGGENGRVMPVYLSLKKPLHIDFLTGETTGADIKFTAAQVRKIIMSVPNIRSTEDSPLLNYGDIDYEGFDKILGQAVKAYAGTSGIVGLRNDFFPDDHAGWLKAFSAATGYDSAYADTATGARHYVAWFPEQIKSAIGNNGNFDSANPDINLSIAEPGLFQPTIWSTPAPTRLDKLIYNAQDGKIDLKRTQEAILKSGQTIAEQYDARLAETLYPGRVAYRSQTFLEVEAQPLLKAMHSNKVGMDELADYLHARGAEERNVQIAKVNPAMPDGGAGTNTKGTLLTTQAARDYLTAISPTRKMVLDAMAKRVDAITAGTRKLLVTEGLEKQDTIDAWTAAYKNYVPMFRDEADEGFPSHPQGSGFAVKGSASKRAMGSTKEVTNILAHVLMQREAAITRAEKNRVALALYGQALSHPNPEFWTTIKPGMQAAQISAELVAMGVDPMTAEIGMAGVPTVQTIDPNTGKVVNRPNPMYKMLPGAIPLKVNGEDRVLMLNTKNERGARLAESLKNLDGLTQLDLAGSIIGRTTRWLAAVNTQYNPAFGLVNLTRDTLGGVIHLGNTELRGNSLKVLAQTPGAILGIARELATGKQSGKWGKLYQQFVADGGQTGFKENFRDPNERADAITKELKAIGRGALSPGKYAHMALDLLDGFNTTLENAVRLSAYSAALDKGISRPQAARLGRELTVDFNRKGRIGREVGPLYAFFNASVQGMNRTLQAINGPTGGKIIAGGLSLGILQALMLAAAGYDDDEIPEFSKTRSLIIPLFGDKKEFISIPYPLGLHVLPNTGRVLTELVLNGGKDIGKRSVAAIGEIAGAFNPLGGGNILTADGALKTIAPTLVDPLIEIGFNKNFAGNGIEKQGYGSETDNRPGVAKTKESTQRSTTGQAYMEISKAMNAVTGGTDYEAGKISPAPERVRYLAQTVGGGVLREIEKTINASTASARGDKVKSSQIPVLGRFYGEVDPDQVQTSRYYNKARELDTLETSIKAAKKAGNGEAMVKIIEQNPEAALITTQNRIAADIAKLNKMAVETINDRDMLKQIDDARVARMSALNQAVEMLEEQSGKTTPGEKVREAAVKAGWK